MPATGFRNPAIRLDGKKNRHRRSRGMRGFPYWYKERRCYRTRPMPFHPRWGGRNVKLPIHSNCGAGNIVGVIGSKEDGTSAYIAGSTQPTPGNAPPATLQFLFRTELSLSRSIDPTRVDDVHIDVVLCQFNRHDTGQMILTAAFAMLYAPQVGKAISACIDPIMMTLPSPCLEQPSRRAASWQVENTPNWVTAAQVRWTSSHRACDDRLAGWWNQHFRNYDIQPAKTLDGSFDHSLDLSRVGHVRLQSQSAPAHLRR